MIVTTFNALLYNMTISVRGKPNEVRMRKHGSGMTLLEVVVAIGLLGVVMVTVFPAFLIANNLDMTSKQVTDANYYGQVQIENIYNRIEVQDTGDIAGALSAFGYTLSGSTWFDYEVIDGINYQFKITYTQDATYPNYGTVLLIVSKQVDTGVYSERSRIENYMRIQQ